MCGRYTLRAPRGHPWLADAPAELGAPRYNIAPGQALIVVARDRDGNRVARAAHWGLRPAWLGGARRAPINARAEGVADKPMFRRAFARGRCLVATDGWYEWQERDDGPKQPWFFHYPDERVFWFAGVAARDPDGRATAAILTRPAAPGPATIHGRMPVVLDDELASGWIDAGRERGWLQELLLAPATAAPGIDLRPVGRAVNRPANDGPQLIEPVPPGGATGR